MNTGTSSFDWQTILLIVAGIGSGLIAILAVWRMIKHYAAKGSSTGYVGQEDAAKGYLSILGDAAMASAAIWAVVYVLPVCIGWIINGIQSATGS